MISQASDGSGEERPQQSARGGSAGARAAVSIRSRRARLSVGDRARRFRMAEAANLLRQETSPYLLQHADNPVHWRPWGKAALEEAQASNKPILLSIGYAACHWCHVMAHESFEDSETAALMNRLFVNVKVDREERP